jgi:hypothetical protein
LDSESMWSPSRMKFSGPRRMSFEIREAGH